MKKTISLISVLCVSCFSAPMKNVDRTEKVGSRVVIRGELKSLGIDEELEKEESEKTLGALNKTKSAENEKAKIERLPFFYTSKDDGKTVDEVVKFRE